MVLLSREHRLFLWFYCIQSSLISAPYSTAALDLFLWYFFWCSVFWRLLIFTAFQSYRLFCLSCTHLHFSQINFILLFSSRVPKLSRSLCSKDCNFQFSGSISCAPFWACLNKFFSSVIVIDCTVICIYSNVQHETNLQITQMCFSIDIRRSVMIYIMLFPCTNFKKNYKGDPAECINSEYLVGFTY